MIHLLGSTPYSGRVACGRRATGETVTDAHKVTCAKCQGTLWYFMVVTGKSYAKATAYIGDKSVRAALAQWKDEHHRFATSH